MFCVSVGLCCVACASVREVCSACLSCSTWDLKKLAREGFPVRVCLMVRGVALGICLYCMFAHMVTLRGLCCVLACVSVSIIYTRTYTYTHTYTYAHTHTPK